MIELLKKSIIRDVVMKYNDSDCAPNGTYDTVSSGTLDLSSTTSADWFVDVLFDGGGAATGNASFQNAGCAVIWDFDGQSKASNAPCDSGAVEN